MEQGCISDPIDSDHIDSDLLAQHSQHDDSNRKEWKLKKCASQTYKVKRVLDVTFKADGSMHASDGKSGRF